MTPTMTFSSPYTESPYHIYLVGTGQIGSTLLYQWQRELPARIRAGLQLQGVCNVDRMALSSQAIELSQWQQVLNRGESTDLDRFVRAILSDSHPYRLFIDATASDECPLFYPRLLEQEVHVVTPNKRANTASSSRYKTLQLACRTGTARFLYETSVGAALPVISTVQNLIRTGDQIETIEGLFSGTLTYLFSAMDEGFSFGEAVREAYRLGYTEPDPRDDLLGSDVARKALILARELGWQLELNNLVLDPLIPLEWTDLSLEHFWQQLETLTPLMQERQHRAQSSGHILRYLARLENGQVRIGLQELDPDHPAARAKGTENVFRLQSHRYHDIPIVINGPGAGKDVTAAGVLADVLSIAGR